MEMHEIDVMNLFTALRDAKPGDSVKLSDYEIDNEKENETNED